MPKPLTQEFQDYSLGERINQLRNQYGDDHHEVVAIGGPAKLAELEEKRIAYLRAEFGPEHLEVKAHDAGLSASDVVKQHAEGADAEVLLGEDDKGKVGDKPSDKGFGRTDPRHPARFGEGEGQGAGEGDGQATVAAEILDTIRPAR